MAALRGKTAARAVLAAAGPICYGTGAMLEKVDLTLSVPKAEYRRRIEPLQNRLYDLVHAAFRRGVAAAIVFEGWAAAGKGSTIGLLTERLDPRGVRVVPVAPPRTFESRYPWLWRYWQRIPAYGQTVIYDTSWYRRVLIGRVGRLVKKRIWQAAYQDIVEFEQKLAAEGTLLLKFWLHVDRREQARRFRKLLGSKLTAWQVTDEDRAQHKAYPKYLAAVEEMLVRTDFPHAPWVIVEATNRYHTRLRVFEEVIRAFETRLREEIPHARARRAAPAAPPKRQRTRGALVFDRLDLRQRLKRDAYSRELKLLQNRLHYLGWEVYQAKRPVAVVFEGPDAAGKGGAIKRLTQRLDPRGYVVWPIGAPHGDDRERHWLYRFWRRLPEDGQIAIFDRSWYGRVLVERVEGFCTDAAWMRAFAEINQFERQLLDHGTVVVKIWMHISKEEQLRRFREREKTHYKSWKLTAEDWRNRGRWADHLHAADEMILKTSTHRAPWTIVEANDKLFARVKVLRAVEQAVRSSL